MNGLYCVCSEYAIAQQQNRTIKVKNDTGKDTRVYWWAGCLSIIELIPGVCEAATILPGENHTARIATGWFDPPPFIIVKDTTSWRHCIKMVEYGQTYTLSEVLAQPDFCTPTGAASLQQLLVLLMTIQTFYNWYTAAYQYLS